MENDACIAAHGLQRLQLQNLQSPGPSLLEPTDLLPSLSLSLFAAPNRGKRDPGGDDGPGRGAGERHPSEDGGRWNGAALERGPTPTLQLLSLMHTNDGIRID